MGREPMEVECRLCGKLEAAVGALLGQCGHTQHRLWEADVDAVSSCGSNITSWHLDLHQEGGLREGTFKL